MYTNRLDSILNPDSIISFFGDRNNYHNVYNKFGHSLFFRDPPISPIVSHN